MGRYAVLTRRKGKGLRVVSYIPSVLNPSHYHPHSHFMFLIPP